jgi:hypothetical protein
MANDNTIGTQSLKGLSGINERFAFFDAGSSSADYRGVRAQELCSELKRYAGARGSFIEKKRDPLAAKQRTRLAGLHTPGQLEKKSYFVCRKVLEFE